MKKIISLMAAASMLAAAIGTASAANNEPSVYVNGGEIMFDDQAAVIVDSRTLVPARGVFEAMGATVEWNGDKREVIVESDDHKTIVRLTIDNPVMTVADTTNAIANLFAGQDNDVPKTEVTLDVPPQIMSDRTMIPLRAISEALNADVQWDSEAYKVDITTTDAPQDKSALPGYYLTTESQAVAGEEVVLYVNAKNIPENTYVSSVTATVKYNSADFEFVSAALVNGDDVVENAMGASNAEFENGYLKTAYVTIDMENAAKADGKVMKLTFKSITGNSGEFSLSNGYQTRLGYNTSLYVESTAESGKTWAYNGNSFDINTSVVTVPAGTAAEATAEPTSAPAETTEPTTEPTAEPSETPVETTEPTETPAATPEA